MREVYKAAIKEYNDEELGIVRLKNPWSNVPIPRSDADSEVVNYRCYFGVKSNGIVNLVRKKA